VKFPSVRWLVAIVATVFCSAAAGCDKQLQGKYTGSMDGERISIEFHGNGKCTLAFASTDGSTDTRQGTYTESAESVTVESGGIPMSFRIDGKTLAGPMGIELVRE
jgi:hypothetical protein